MTTITNSDVIGVTTATKYIEGVETHSFIINVQHFKEALAVAESLGFVDSDNHIKILSTNNPADGLLVQSLQYPKGSVRCACVEVVPNDNMEKERSTEEFKAALVADHNEKFLARHDELSGLSNAEDAMKAKDALERINGECDYVEEVKSIIDKVNQLPSCIPIETRIVHLKVCGVDGGECNFKYRRYPSWHIMGEFDMEVSECRLSGIPKSYPTHLKHCEHTR